MGQEAETNERKQIFQSYQINDKLTKEAAKGHIILHCLPAHKGEEITVASFEQNAQHIFNQAQNRMYAQMAILASIM